MFSFELTNLNDLKFEANQQRKFERFYLGQLTRSEIKNNIYE